MTKTIADFPAYRIVDESDREFEDGDVIAVPYDRRPDLWSFYKLGSVAAFARMSKSDPDAAVQRAKETGEELYYAFSMGATLTAWTRDKEIVAGFRIGDSIKFAGLRFRIERAPNNNIRLIQMRKLTREQAVALSCAFLAEHAARERLAAGDMEAHDIWLRMRDDKLSLLFGMGLIEIHNFGHGKQEAE